MKSVRATAARVLVSIEGGQTTLGGEIERARPDILDPRDRGLLLELVAGTLRWQNALDWILASAGRRDVASLSPEVRATLRLGVYQLTRLDRVPAHAVVNEAVEAVRSLGQARAAGLVNAILRRVLRAPPPLPARPDDIDDRAACVRYLSIALSHPSWLVERWLDRYGFDTAERWCQFNNRSPEMTVRSVGRLSTGELAGRLEAEGLRVTRTAFAADALRLPPGALGRTPLELRREFVVQDEGSQLVAAVVGALPEQRVLDLCAAPGGKTLLLAAAMRNRGLLVASDRRPRRVRLLRETVRSFEVGAAIACLDAERALPFGVVFDRVLLDAPCSGLGTLRRDPDLKWSRTPSDLDRLAQAQGRMLARAAEVVVPGGLLVYATCSSEPEENHEVVSAFLASDRRFERRSAALPATASALINGEGALETRPAPHGLDAFYAAVLVRRQAT